MWNKIKEIIGQYLSVEESRKSIVILVLIGITIMGLYKAYYGIDVPNNTMTIIVTLSGYVFGINIGNSISNMYGNYMSRSSGMNVESENQTTNNNQINNGV